jgi:hypothetical protein
MFHGHKKTSGFPVHGDCCKYYIKMGIAPFFSGWSSHISGEERNGEPAGTGGPLCQ